jgi:hypothetical protein
MRDLRVMAYLSGCLSLGGLLGILLLLQGEREGGCGGGARGDREVERWRAYARAT